MEDSLPNAKSTRDKRDRLRIKRAIEKLQLCGLANDTKWNELINSIRSRDWRPSYRFKCVDGVPSRWDVEWFYHLPFPMISVQWLDVCYLQQQEEHRLPVRVRVIDHSPWLEQLLNQIGLEYQKGKRDIRIFGYSPKDLDLFEA